MVLAVLETLDLPVHLRIHALELPVDVPNQLGVGLERLAVECGVALRHLLFVHHAPADLVLVAPEIPLVIHE